jgi:hypothetical protein
MTMQPDYRKILQQAQSGELPNVTLDQLNAPVRPSFAKPKRKRANRLIYPNFYGYYRNWGDA